MGGDVGAVSLAVAVFMTGLALGGALGGWWGRRRDPLDCLRSLMVAELCVALFSLAGLSGMRSLNAWSAVMGCPPQLGAGLLILACMLPSAMASIWQVMNLWTLRVLGRPCCRGPRLALRRN